MKKLLAVSLACAAMLGASVSAIAADFPIKDKIITIVVPFTAGGPTDRVARDLAEAMRKPLGGISIVVDNAAGAGGSIGANKAAKATPDGHTLLLHHIGMGTMPMWFATCPSRLKAILNTWAWSTMCR